MACFETFKIETVYSLLAAIPAIGLPLHLNFSKGPYISQNRERIFSEALRIGATFLMFIDTDVTFPPDAIAKLLATQKPIIGVPYNMKKLPLQTTLKMPDPSGVGYLTGSFALPSEPFKAAVVPGGFMLLHLPSVTAKMSAPFFDGDLREDVFFCEKARASGLDVWADPRIPVKHIGDHAY